MVHVSWSYVSPRGRSGVGGGREELELRRFSADPTRIYRMPEDQVAKRGTTVQLECRVKHDPSLKLSVSWLKDDEPLYISNRSPLLPPRLLLSGALPPPLLLAMRGRARGSRVGVSLQNR